MGCDIHIIAEVKIDGQWVKNKDKIFPNPGIKGLRDDPDDGRDYDWFSILAGVRNGYGCAGCITGEGFSVIAQPRGIPDDASNEWIDVAESWDGDGHSFSYLTISDFDAFDWTQTSKKTGVIPFWEYINLRGTNRTPDGWSGAISGNNIITIDPNEADAHLFSPVPRLEGKEIYVSYSWTIKYSEWFENKIKNVIEPLRELEKKYGEARICFFFDN